MDIRTELRGDALIAMAPNRIDSANAPEFQTALQVAVDQHDCAMVLDLEELTYISSAGSPRDGADRPGAAEKA